MAYYAYIGMDKEEIDTPALLIDLDALEKNLKIMADYYRKKKGAALLPHQKGHRLPIIAKKQIDAGAKGVSMTSLGLAEYYADCGLTDVPILITNEIYGLNKIRRLCSLSKRANVTVGCDNIDNVRQLSEVALANNIRINVAVELRVGASNAGVEIGEAARSLVKEIVKFKGVKFKGLWEHQGDLSRIENWEERKKAHFDTLGKIATLKDEIEDGGTNVEMVSAGFSCTWNITPEYARLSNVEVQAGNYVFNDWCLREGTEGMKVFDYALTVLTRCISKPKPDTAIFDFGLNSCSVEATQNYRSLVGPKFKNLEGVKEVREREEIAAVALEKSGRDIKVGEPFELIPPHADTTAKLHDRYYCMRNNKLEAIWLNYGRGLH
jgi:D-serine deaminase-like pyridoxal phosphate-dependent protein